MIYRVYSIFILGCLLFPLNGLADNHERGDKYLSVRNKLQLCFTCHGQAGESPDPTYPVLSGQHLYYIYVQLKDFKSGLREHEVMGPIAASLEKEEMMLIAQYFSEQNWPDLGHKYKTEELTVEKTKLGKKVIDAGQCVQCHLGGFEGNSGFPRLAGQYREYLVKTMLDFKKKVRKNDAAKSSLFATFNDEEIKAVAAYLSGFKEE